MDVAVMPMGTHEYVVNLTEGDHTTSHRVVVPEELAPERDEQRLVQESLAVFLEHQSPSSLPQDLTLDWIADHVPEFDEELRARLEP